MIIDLTKIPDYDFNSREVPNMAHYNSIWGFYMSQQTVNYTYENTGLKGYSLATVTIDGYFTINAEISYRTYGYCEELNSSMEAFEIDNVLNIVKNMSDQEKSDILFEKYSNLKQLIISRAKKSAPDELIDFGTDSDSRCVELPSKLRDLNGNPVYMMPTGLSLRAERSPVILNYTATLTEVKQNPCLIDINGIKLENASITITGRKPRINDVIYAYANGGEHYFTGYNNRKISVKGNVRKVANPDKSIILDTNDTEILNNISENGYFELNIDKLSGIVPVMRVYLDRNIASLNKDKGNASIELSGEQVVEEE